MKRWQRTWLTFALLFSTLHLLRDILQNLGVHNLFTTFFAKQTHAPLWLEITALTSEALNSIVSFLALKRNQFGTLGVISMGLFGIFVLLWAYYTFLL